MARVIPQAAQGSAFDFHALAANAPTIPDDHVYTALQDMEDVLGKWRQCRFTKDHVRMLKHVQAAETAVVNAKPDTVEGILAKLNLAHDRLQKSSMMAMELSAVRDAIEWLGGAPPKPRRTRRRRA